jgi:hypothetical protein
MEIYIKTHPNSAFLTIILREKNFPARSIRPRIVLVLLPFDDGMEILTLFKLRIVG